ncbi:MULTISPECIES: Lrp/AsnC family transcriptional regulator [Dermacoccus]|uniref:Lrp/AsnC family transcriptional regulator n=1 Tax=Dermacoccus TaxID=57495 RepID=UPI0009401473|nr:MULTISPECIES: Lrp/AsnC ligand binding domain-containing protein [Dermacoccus]MBO1758842.1 Lrp/AsnC ligand binding domain-containing protein [Dermacoccus sp. NHGro5]TCJ91440.1 AsnC family transcriptional regulator [Dermacoccus sp. SAI-028]HCQ19015.1 Lrp/AsnC family transcriptional regulator [Dermacoccus sp.]
MITAIVLIKADVARIPEVAQHVADVPGVMEVYSVTGGVDLIAMVRVTAYEQLAEVISGSINKVDGVLETDTHLAFRTYSQRDLDAGFDLGLDD